jgi:hypothetical protein
MNKILTNLLVAAALSCSIVFAEDTPRATVDNSKHQVVFTLHGKTSCVLVDDKIFCAPATMRAPTRLASSAAY